MKKLLVRLLSYLDNIEEQKVIHITFLPKTKEEFVQTVERLKRLKRLHKEYGMPITDGGVMANAMRIYEHIILEEIGNGRPFFQKVEGDMIPVEFFFKDLE